MFKHRISVLRLRVGVFFSVWLHLQSIIIIIVPKKRLRNDLITLCEEVGKEKIPATTETFNRAGEMKGKKWER